MASGAEGVLAGNLLALLPALQDWVCWGGEAGLASCWLHRWDSVANAAVLPIISP